MSGPELLVLAKHAPPLVSPRLPASDWPLLEEGIDDARRLGARWLDLGLDVVVSSTELKARQTAAEVADVLGVTFHTADGLHEHERPFIGDRAQFEGYMERFFADESAHRPVERRFSAAVDAIARVHQGARLAIVAHGTVIALHLAARYGLDAHTTWARLGMPSYAVVELRTRTLVDLVDSL